MRAFTQVVLALAALAALVGVAASVLDLLGSGDRPVEVTHVRLPDPLLFEGQRGVGLREEPPRPPAQPCTLVGRVVDVLRIPVAGARVTLVHDPERFLRVGDDGRFRWILGDDRSLARKAEPLRLRVSCNGFATRELSVAFADGATRDLGDVRLEPGGAVSGRVVDASGAGVPGVRVVGATPTRRDDPAEDRLRGPPTPLGETRTSASGAFTLEGVPQGMLRVWAKAEGAPWTLTGRVPVRPGYDSRGVELVVEPSGARE